MLNEERRVGPVSIPNLGQTRQRNDWSPAFGVEECGVKWFLVAVGFAERRAGCEPLADEVHDCLTVGEPHRKLLAVDELPPAALCEVAASFGSTSAAFATFGHLEIGRFQNVFLPNENFICYFSQVNLTSDGFCRCCWLCGSCAHWMAVKIIFAVYFLFKSPRYKITLNN